MKDKVIDAIKTREVKMRSRRYFIARGVFVVIASVLLFFLILFLAVYVIFALRENGGIFATGFGVAGWGIFFESLPWTPFLASIALLLVLWVLLSRYKVVYHRPFLYVLLMLIIVITFAGYLLSASAFPRGIFYYVARNHIPVVSGVYQFETAPMSGIYRGEVVILATSSFILENGLGQTSTVVMAQGALPELIELAPGDFVFIFGRGVATATIQAFGVERTVNFNR